MLAGAVVAGSAGGGVPAGAAESGSTIAVSDVTDDDRYSVWPSISPDGGFVAFSLARWGDPFPNFRVRVRNIETGVIIPASVSSDGSFANANSYEAAISGANPTTGNRYVAFSSEADNLVPNDLNDTSDVFVHEFDPDTTTGTTTGTTTRVSVSSPPLSLEGNEISRDPAISANGRHVAFKSQASTLVVGDTNRRDDVFVHDLDTGVTTRVSVAGDGTQGNGDSSSPSLSADGRYVAFSSSATNLAVGGSGVLVHDRSTNATTLIASGGGAPSISSDGRYVAFDKDGIHVHDRTIGTTIRVAPEGFSPSISGNGRYVAFTCCRLPTRTLVACDTNKAQDVHVYDLATARTSRVSVASDGTQGNRGSAGPSMSSDGYVAFYSDASNLVPGDTNEQSDVFRASTQPPPSRPVVSVGDVAVHEGDSGTRAAVFTVSLSKPSSCNVTVAYATNSTTATAGVDYTSRTGTLSFTPDTTALTVKVPVTGDSLGEDEESFSLSLSSPTKSTLGDATGTGTIYDDDPPAIPGPRMAIGDAKVHEGDSGARTAVFNVSLSSPSASTVTASFATATGSATAIDFTPKTGTVSFAPGTTSASVKVAILPDELAEGAESFTVALSRASGDTIVDATGGGTILDDD